MCFHFYFTSLVYIPIKITSSAVALQICAIPAGIKKYKSIIKKTKHNKIVFLVKSKLNSIEVLIPKALIDSVISYDEFVLINNLLKEHNEMKEEIVKSSFELSCAWSLSTTFSESIYKRMSSNYCLKCRNDTENKNPKVAGTKNKSMFLSKCALCDSKKSKCVKHEQASRLLSSLGIKTPLNKILLVGLLVRTHPTPFFKGEEENFDYLPRTGVGGGVGESEKN